MRKQSAPAKCEKCGQAFKSLQGVLSHDRAIHQGIKVGGNPALLSEDRARGLADKALGKAGLHLHNSCAEMVTCPACLPCLLRAMRDAGYQVKEPSVSMSLSDRILSLGRA
jgi:hypothetical protein